jgi:hypothetical protein
LDFQEQLIFPVNSLIFELLTSKNRAKDFKICQMRAFSVNSLLIPCSGALQLRNPAIHAAFHACLKKIPVVFPVIAQMDQTGPLLGEQWA